MSVVMVGDVPYDLRPFVVESIVHFRFVRLNAARWLTAELTAAFNRNMGRTIREGGTRITPAERVAMGFDRWDGGHISREVWAALTKSGRDDPVAHFDATCARTGHRLRSRAQAERHRRTSHIFAGVKFDATATTLLPCAAALNLDGRIMEEPPALLPLPNCDRERCGCSWRGVSPWELRRSDR